MKYTGQELTITGATAGLTDFKIDIGGLSNRIKIISSVPEIMKALDNNQYLLCRQADQLKTSKDHFFRDYCLRIRLMHILAFTQLQAILSVEKVSEDLTKELTDWIQYMSKLTSGSIELLIAALPNFATEAIEQMKIERGMKERKEHEKQEKRREKYASWRMEKFPRITIFDLAGAELKEVKTYQGIEENEMKKAVNILMK